MIKYDLDSRIKRLDEKILKTEGLLKDARRRYHELFERIETAEQKEAWWDNHGWIGWLVGATSLLIGVGMVVPLFLAQGLSVIWQTLCAIGAPIFMVGSIPLFYLPRMRSEDYHNSTILPKEFLYVDANMIENEIYNLELELSAYKKDRVELTGKAEVDIDHIVEEKTEPTTVKTIDKKAEKKKGLVARMAEKKAKKAEEKAKKAAKKAKEAKKKAKQAEDKATRAEERAKKAAEKAKEAQAKVKAPNGQTAKKKEDTKEDSADSGLGVDE